MQNSPPIRLFTRRELGTANKHPPEILPADGNPEIESQDRIRRLPYAGSNYIMEAQIATVTFIEIS